MSGAGFEARVLIVVVGCESGVKTSDVIGTNQQKGAEKTKAEPNQGSLSINREDEINCEQQNSDNKDVICDGSPTGAQAREKNARDSFFRQAIPLRIEYVRCFNAI